MSPGQIARRVLGPVFPVVGEAYRRFFVDMPCVVEAMSDYIPRAAHVLDVGGGDGYVANLLLDLRPDLRVTLTDLAASVGSFLSPANRSRVTLRPATDLPDLAGCFDVLTLADVVHHVPLNGRAAFLASVGAQAQQRCCSRILVKDIRPGGFRASASLLADRYITGDRSVALAPEDTISFPGYRRIASLMPDFPNYLLVFEANA